MGISNNLQKVDEVHSIQIGLQKEVVMPLEFIVPSLQISLATHMTNE
jgi:hypothetical protein